MKTATTATTAAIDTWLPLHPGYYESRLYHSDMDNEAAGYFLDSELPELPEYLHAAIGEQIETDFQGYQEATSRQFCAAVETLLTDILGSEVTIVYQGIHSPREYNFTTDTVNVSITMKRAALVRYFAKYGGEMAGYFKARYTSYDGFISHYPATLDYWRQFENWDNHGLGAVLEAVLVHHYGEESEAEEAALCGVEASLCDYMSIPPNILNYLQSDAVEGIAELVEKQRAEVEEYRKIMTGRLSPDTLHQICGDALELAESQARETLMEALEEL